MAFNGSGTYVLPGAALADGQTISATEHNTLRNDMATALSDCVTRDGQSPATANLPMGGFKHTGVAVAAALTDYTRADQCQNSSLSYLTSVAGVDTITATATPSPSAYASGQTFRFVSAGANTGAVTLNISSLGAVNVTKQGTSALVAGDIPASALVTVTHDGTRFQLMNVNTVPGSTAVNFSANNLTAAGLVDISGASAGQIKFPATQNASADANTLDDYEEGTFSPTIYGTLSAGAGTYTTQSGRYIKIGRFVFASVGITWTAHTGTGNMGIGNLPFTCFNSSTVGYQSMNVQAANLTVPASTYVAGQVVPSTTTMLLYSVAAAGNVWSALAIDTAATLIVEFTYEASA